MLSFAGDDYFLISRPGVRIQPPKRSAEKPMLLKPDFELASKYQLATVAETDRYGKSDDFCRRSPANCGYFALSAVGSNSLHDEAYFYVEHIEGLAVTGIAF